MLESCVATLGQSCYDEGILKRGEPIPVLIPRYDVDGQCRRSNANPRVCIEAEQEDYEVARRVWPHLLEKSQRDCVTSFRTEGERRYRGDEREKILEMLRSAAAKDLGAHALERPPYDPGEVGPVPVGYMKDDSYVFRDRERPLLIPATAQQLLSGQFPMGIAPPWFWAEQFASAKGMINSIDAGQPLMAACRARGPFFPDKRRGLGVWREGSAIKMNLVGDIPTGKHPYLRFKPIELVEGARFDVAAAQAPPGVHLEGPAGCHAAAGPACGRADLRHLAVATAPLRLRSATVG